MSLLDKARAYKEPSRSWVADIPTGAMEQYELAISLLEHRITTEEFAEATGYKKQYVYTYAKMWVGSGIKRGHLKVTYL